MAGVDFNEEKNVRDGGQELDERDRVAKEEKERADASGGTSATPTELAGGAATGGGDGSTAGLGVPGGSAPAGDAPGDAGSPSEGTA